MESENKTVNENDFVPHYVNNYVKEKEWLNTGTQDIMVFHPTMEEFKDFPGLIKKIEKAGAHLASGICKIVPPKEWNPRPSKRFNDYSDIESFNIQTPVKESIEGASGCFTRSIKVYRKRMSVSEFKKIATSKDYLNPKLDYGLPDLERHYWRSLLFGEPIYGADTPGTLYDANVKEFNMKNLGTVLDLLNEQKIKIAGVNTIFLYFGMWKTTFPWHAEDMDLYSINYLHYGEPKFWYAIPSQAAEKFERLACQQFPDGSMICKAFLRHKLYIISPTLLKNHSIPYGTMVQYPNEFIITFPKGYHMGFNVGYNCAESTNFALERWIDFGKNAVLCHCREDGVEIDMRPFMKKYRPEEFKIWHDYWYGERHTSIKFNEKKAKKKKHDDPILEAIYFERHKRLSHAKRSVKNIWAQSPINLYYEKEFNIKRGKMFPFCNVCQYFIPRRILIAQKMRSHGTSLPKFSRRFVTDQQFFKDTYLPKERQIMIDDFLFECVNCHVVVHRNCYPVFDGMPEENNVQEFRCIRCLDRDDVAIRSTSCALCELRGGALIETTIENGVQQFVHIICAIIHSKTRFLEPENRRKVYRPPPKWLIPESSTEHNNSSVTDVNILSYNIDIKSASSSLTNNKISLDLETKNDINQSSFSSSLSQKESTTSSSDFDESKLSSIDCFDILQNNNCLSENNNSLSLDASNCLKTEFAAARYQCEVCNGLSHNLVQCHICLQTEENSAAASLRYHITCAPLADMTFERRDIAPYTTVVCPFHNSCHVISKPDLRKILEGDRVFVTLNNIELNDKIDQVNDTSFLSGDRLESITVHKGHVLSSWESLYCTVDFLDGSVSSDLFPCDIRRCECHHFGCKNNHLPGSLVYVQWHDNKIYEAYYRGKAPARKYSVQLQEDNSNWESTSFVLNTNDKQKIVELEQNEIFSVDEPLPEEVRIALIKRKSEGL